MSSVVGLITGCLFLIAVSIGASKLCAEFVMEWGEKKKSTALRSHDMIAYSYFPWLSVTQLGPRSDSTGTENS